MIKEILNDNCTIYNADCFEVMKELKKQKIEFDLVLTDPPYGTIKGISHIKNTDWDTKLNTRQMVRSIANITRDKGRIILFSQEPYTSELRTIGIGNIYFTQPAIWLKNTWGNPFGAKKCLLNVYEDLNLFIKEYDTNFTNPLRNYSKKILDYIGLSYKKINKMLNHRKLEHFFYWNLSQFELCSKKAYEELISIFKIDKMEGFLNYEEMKKIYASNKKFSVFNLNGATSKKNVFNYLKESTRYHTAQKPIELLKDLILTYSNKNDLILDFTMGSGSTGVACMMTDRKFIGIEINKDFYKIAKERILKNMK